MQIQQNYDLDTIFQALSDSTRRAILRQVIKGEQSVTEIAKPYDLTLAAVSKHLKVLESARLIEKRKTGSFQPIRLNPDALKSADAWLSYYRRFWEGRLSSLKTLLEEETEK